MSMFELEFLNLSFRADGCKALSTFKFHINIVNDIILLDKSIPYTNSMLILTSCLGIRFKLVGGIIQKSCIKVQINCINFQISWHHF